MAANRPSGSTRKQVGTGNGRELENSSARRTSSSRSSRAVARAAGNGNPRSAIAWRAHFRSFASAEFYLDTPGIAASNLARFDYKKAPRPLYPLDDDAAWPS